MIFPLPTAVPDPAEAFFQTARVALASGAKGRVESLFARREDAAYLFDAATRSAPLAKWRVNVIPAPPGWSQKGGYWATFHTRQPIEQDHDPVYPVVSTLAGLKLGEEIPETEASTNAISRASIDVHLVPANHRAEVATALVMSGTGGARADVLRLQDIYRLRRARVDGRAARVVTADATGIPHPESGDVLRAGGLIVPWTGRPARTLTFAYDGILPKGDAKGLDEDRVEVRTGYLTAWWTPSTARLPFRTETRVTAPKDWTVRSEGVPVPTPTGGAFPPGAEEARTAWRCDVPISFPKVIAGRYVLAASLEANGRLYRSYQFAPVDRKRAEGDVRAAADAIRFFEARFGAFPFPGYDVLDGDDYYGIESYSYTLLAPKITPWATTHEIGHTYFGGLAPCPYVRDSWNEGVTQYVDSVLFKGDADGTLRGALRQTDLHVPLTRMAIPYAESGTTYYRGAYAMAMLAHEIGEAKVVAGLRAMVADRRGRDTVWADLRPYFEATSARPLDWFWRQWIEGSEWPTLTLGTASTLSARTGFRTRVVVSQRGTPKPMRLRFVVRLSGGGRTADQEVTLEGATETFDMPTAFKPSEARLEILGYVFGKAGGTVPVVVG